MGKEEETEESRTVFSGQERKQADTNQNKSVTPSAFFHCQRVFRPGLDTVKEHYPALRCPVGIN